MDFESIWIILLLVFFFGGTIRRAIEQRRPKPERRPPPDVVITDEEWGQAARRVRPGVKPPPQPQTASTERVAPPAERQRQPHTLVEHYQSIEEGPTFDTGAIDREVADIEDAAQHVSGLRTELRQTEAPAGAPEAAGTGLISLLRDPRTVQQAVVAAEVLGRPRARQKRRPFSR